MIPRTMPRKKKTLKLEETKKAKNNRLRAQGLCIEPNLTPGRADAITQDVVEQILSFVPDGRMFYVATSQSLLVLGLHNQQREWHTPNHQGELRPCNQDNVAG